MRRLLLCTGAGVLLGVLAAQVLAKPAIYPLSIFGRRLSPAWIKFDKDAVQAWDLKELYDRVDDKEEFHAMVLTNEVHGHIGPWSVLGCKMAMRAMDLLSARHLAMTAISEGGTSLEGGAVTDGLALGGGCTIGLGTLRVSGGPPSLAATFLHEDQAVRLEIEPPLVAALRDSVAAIETETGGDQTTQYWKRLRVLGIHVWEKWDRDEIFAETWVDAAGLTAVEETPTGKPAGFSLDQNAPNPFNAGTAISFSLPRQTPVTLEVYDVAGQKVRTLLQGEVAGGPTRLTWDGTDDAGRQAAGGVYFYRLVSGDGHLIANRKMCLLK